MFPDHFSFVIKFILPCRKTRSNNLVIFHRIHNAAHPRPGQPYEGQTLTHTIYKTTEGSGVVILLEKAFHAQILVTVKENSLCWNGDIFRAYSYYEDNKDPSRIRTRLAEIGIK